MNDQRSTTDQLRDAVHILNQHGLYDASDHCRREVERVDAKLRANAAAAAWCQQPEHDGPYGMVCSRALVDGVCGRHGKQTEE